MSLPGASFLSPDEQYEILEGVRRAKAADLAGHREIRAEILDRQGRLIAVGNVPLVSLRSPKSSIRRITRTDEDRWNRVVRGAQQAKLPFPPIVIQPGTRGTKIREVGFDFGGRP